MTATVFDGCTDLCGWFAAIVAALTYGSYGVTIKEASKVGVEVSPLVMQTYKTCVFFLMCPLVVFLGEDLSWTPIWGLLSGALWVPGATLGIYGVQMAGMATAEGVWSSVIVIVNFVCLVIFGEHVKSLGETLCAFVLLTVGLVGMSRYSAPNASAKEDISSSCLYDTCNGGSSDHYDLHHLSINGGSKRGGRKNGELSPMRSSISEQSSANNSDDEEMVVVSRRKRKGSVSDVTATDLEMAPLSGHMAPLSGRFVIPENLEQNSFDELPSPTAAASSSQPAGEKGPKDRIRIVAGMTLTRRQAGIIAAALNGLFGGTSLIPMHYAAKEGYSGARYFVSFATGSMIVQVIWWMGLVAYRIGLNRGSIHAAMTNLPEFHFQKVWLPLFLSGILFSIGMLGSIIAVAYLGQGIGNTFVQCKILIAGLWGIFYYQEIRGVSTVTKFFVSAVFALLGILALSHEHSHIAHH